MHARLTIEQGKGSPQTLDLVPASLVSLGRSRENTIILHDEHASRQHAQISFENEQWLLRDLGTLNGTQLNGERITQPIALENNQVIGIADMRLRFQVHDRDLEAPASGKTAAALPAPAPLAADVLTTALWADELATLYGYMTATVEEKDPAAVIERTLETIAGRTQATVSGFLNLDPDNPLSKKVYPQSAEVDAQLSRQLTLRVQQTGRTAWLREQTGDIGSSDSLACYFDAICVPLKAEGTSLGALHVYKGQRPFNDREVRFCEVVAGFAANTLARLRLCRSLEAENSRLRLHAPAAEELVCNSPAMLNLRQLIARAAASDVTVLIQGETGVGKELVALALHRQSPRAQGPLVVANCGAIAESLYESELFGHCRGAFTGAASAHCGLFQQADDGILFLDEIGDMPLEGQVKLLRAIETKSFRPLGSTRDVRVDVRVIAATHRDLEHQVKVGNFRQDLFFRLRVISIAVPPLRDHAEDIPGLAEYFLARLVGPQGRPKKISGEALRRLQEYNWPGNVRQLRAILENAAIMGEGETIQVSDLALPKLDVDPQPASLNLADIEARGISQVLDKTDGNITQAAKILDIDRGTLIRKIKQYKLAR